jgi:hypothetical protein
LPGPTIIDCCPSFGIYRDIGSATSPWPILNGLKCVSKPIEQDCVHSAAEMASNTLDAVCHQLGVPAPV